MLEFADIFRQYGPAYRAKYGDRMLPSHIKAMEDIESCRTQVMGGHVYSCDACDQMISTDHSCGNRHCPKCGSDRADDWRDKHLQTLLPVNYFLVTCTFPHSLNDSARSHQKLIYRLLFQTSADALQTLALNSEWLGAEIGMVGALHTWDRRMAYHLHVHYLVPAGGSDPKTGAWKAAPPHIPGAWLSPEFCVSSNVPRCPSSRSSAHLRSRAVQTLVKELGCALQTGWKRKNRAEIPDTVYLSGRPVKSQVGQHAKR